MLRNRHFITAISLLSLLLLWELAAIYVNNATLLPPLLLLGKELVAIFLSPDFLPQLGQTLLRGIIGVTIAITLSIPISMLAAHSRWFHLYIQPPLVLIRSTPVVSFILFFLIWFTPPYIPIALALITMSPILIENLTRGFQSLDKSLAEMAYLFQIPTATRYKQIIFPQLKPHLFSALILSLGYGFKAVIIGEALANPHYGIGVSIQQSKLIENTPALLAWTLVTLMLGFVIEKSVRFASHKSFAIRFIQNKDYKPFHINPLTEAITINHLTVNYQNKPILKELTATINSQQITHLTGKSGSGKTTLLRTLSKLQKGEKGTIEMADNSRISYLFQEPRLVPHLTVIENILLPLAHLYPKKEAMKIAATWLTRLELNDQIFSLPNQLSGGERQRAAIARTFAYPANLWLLDEPFQGIDTLMQEKISTEIEQCNKDKKITVILVTHLPQNDNDNEILKL